MKKDISANLYQKCLILCSNILQNVLHNMSLTDLLPLQHTGFQTSPISMPFLATFGIPFWYMYLPMVPPYAWSSKHMNMLGWVHGLFKYFLSWKSLKYWNQVGGDWKSTPVNYCRRCAICRTISLPSFSGLCWKLTKITLFIYLI